MKIAVAGLGYVGLSNAVLLSQYNEVLALDLNASRVDAVNSGRCPIEDADIQHFLSSQRLKLRATTDPLEAYADADFVIVATPTDYDPATQHFDTTSVEQVIHAAMQCAPKACIVIKSTIPVGFTQKMRERTGLGEQLFFSPEFLREGKALHDNLYPSRIIVGAQTPQARVFADLLKQAALRQDVPVLLTHAGEAEAIKLFSNTFLAMRVAYFNELDSYALSHGLESRQIIEGVGLDPRIGSHYNNPSFGYGGYCLPKDTRQLLANFDDVPQNLIRAIVESNETRKDFVASAILARKPHTVGVYRMIMKAGSDNFRSSSMLGIMERLGRAGVKLVLHEPKLEALPEGLDVTPQPDLAQFKKASDLIIANRMHPELQDVAHKVFTRDLFGSD